MPNLDKIFFESVVGHMSPNDALRIKLMPIAKTYEIDDIIKACAVYSSKTGRRVTYEYALAAGVNDSMENAVSLANKLNRELCHVNLIALNDTVGSRASYAGSDQGAITAFAKILTARGVNTTIRRRLGSDINASCGQLRYYADSNRPVQHKQVII